MVEKQLRARGIRDDGVLHAMSLVPRELFVPPERRDLAYQDRAVPLSRGQTVSQPYIVAFMTQALSLRRDDRVLEVGTGSGYQTAVLAHIAGQVYSVERLASLATQAEARLAELGLANVTLQIGDGSLGWPLQAPFDAVIVTAGAPRIPDALKDQMSPEGGRLVIPIGDRALQELIRFERRGNEYRAEALLACRFVPLLGAQGWVTS
jgi:protein-L-isoaspartate(D-aspartate) O-methyltransferase